MGAKTVIYCPTGPSTNQYQQRPRLCRYSRRLRFANETMARDPITELMRHVSTPCRRSQERERLTLVGTVCYNTARASIPCTPERYVKQSDMRIHKLAESNVLESSSSEGLR